MNVMESATKAAASLLVIPLSRLKFHVVTKMYRYRLKIVIWGKKKQISKQFTVCLKIYIGLGSWALLMLALVSSQGSEEDGKQVWDLKGSEGKNKLDYYVLFYISFFRLLPLSISTKTDEEVWEQL